MIGTNPALLLACLLVVGCGGGSATGEEEHGEHQAPPGTVGVALGDHLAQLTVALDASTGTLTIRVYDGHLEKPIRVAQKAVEVRVLQPPGEFVRVQCAAQADPLSGETVGDTATFKGQDDALKGLEKFDAVLVQLDVRGNVVKEFKFPYPAGVKLH